MILGRRGSQRGDEHGYDTVDLRLTLGPLVASLPERDREMVQLRFVERWTEARIAEHVGISQSYVSRSLRRILRELRRALDGGDA